MMAARMSFPWLSRTMSNQASTSSSVPVVAASAPTHGDRRHAASAVRAKASARPTSNPVQTTSQRSVV